MDDLSEKIENLQSQIGHLRQVVNDSGKLSFHALNLAWQATRLAYYASKENYDMIFEKLEMTKTDLSYFEQQLEIHYRNRNRDA